jgi:GxxExxY protein
MNKFVGCLDSETEKIASQVIDGAIKVHSVLGPGLLESAYQMCLEHELRKRGIKVECEILQPIFYDGFQVNAGYRLDMLVEERIIIENKVVENILPVHEAQLLTYLRLRKCRLGFLFNWNVVLLKDGIKRMVFNI